MGSRILIEFLVLLSPFAIYGLYRIALTEAVSEGKKPWPVQRLFLIGFILAIVAWIVLAMLDPRECRAPSTTNENGRIVKGEVIPCERNTQSIGLPASDDPGG